MKMYPFSQLEPRHFRPAGLLAGFHSMHPSRAVPELRHVGEQWASGTWGIDRHQHRGWEIYLQLAGTSVWHAEGSVYRVGGGEGYVVAPGTVHHLHAVPSRDHHYVFASIEVESLSQRLPELSGAWISGPRFRVVAGDGLRVPFRQLVHEVSVDGTFRDQALRLALDQLVVATSRTLLPGHEKPVLPAPQCVLDACRLIDRHPERSWALRDLSVAVHVSVSRLSGLFSTTVGRTPHQYLLARRIELACEWLRDSDRAITDIAYDLGFSSSQHFARAFRAEVGTTARAYRETSRHRLRT